jgi:ACT domain-containing protein
VASYLIRVQLPDRPGALGAVASRIGSAGGDVVSIDILERHDGVVVDELGVGLAGDHLVTLVRDEILEVDGAFIESVRKVDDPMPDRLAELLDVATDLFVQPTRDDVFARLAAHARRSLFATFAAVVEPRQGGVVAADGVTPELEELRALAASSAEPASDGTARSGVARADLARSGLVLVVGRDDPVLRARERKWISIMAELADQCGRVLPSSADV